MRGTCVAVCTAVSVTPDMTKWLLDTVASIHTDTTGHGVQNEKPSSVTVNIANGNIVTPRGVGEKTILDYETGYPLKIRKMHVIPEFAKIVLSVSKLIDNGYEVQFM